MRILFVSTIYPSDEAPQYCIFLEQQAEALKALGHEISILLVSSLANVEEKVYYKGERKEIPIYEWVFAKKRVADILLLPLKTRVLNEFFRTHKFDVVSIHFLGLKPALAVSRLCKKQKVAAVQHYHGLNIWHDYHQTKKQKFLSAYAFGFKLRYMRMLNAIVGVSDLTCDEVKKFYCRKNVYTVYNGVNTELFSASKKETNASSFVVLCVANLIPIKGQIYLLEAVRNCLVQEYNVELRIAGVGPDRAMLEQKCVDLGIERQVTFLGNLPYENVAAEMAQADMFILPSFYEAFGCVYVEAMACGTLTCGCENNGAKEIITHKVNGLLVQEKNATAISDMIRYAIENPVEVKRISEAGRVRASELNWDASARQLEMVYIKACMQNNQKH